MSQSYLSARAYHRILKLARKIAALSRDEDVQSVQLTDALHASQPSEVDDEVTRMILADYLECLPRFDLIETMKRIVRTAN